MEYFYSDLGVYRSGSPRVAIEVYDGTRWIPAAPSEQEFGRLTLISSADAEALIAISPRDRPAKLATLKAAAP